MVMTTINRHKKMRGFVILTTLTGFTESCISGALFEGSLRANKSEARSTNIEEPSPILGER
jgi:hypothetical protein